MILAIIILSLIVGGGALSMIGTLLPQKYRNEKRTFYINLISIALNIIALILIVLNTDTLGG